MSSIAQQPILITVPARYMTIPRLRPEIVMSAAPTSVPAATSNKLIAAAKPVHSSPAADAMDVSSSIIDPVDEFLVRGKKRRLDHLSWEEKFQRKKLKNRVAAQTSRDRKKAKLDEIESALQAQTDQNEALQRTCTVLKQERDRALAHNAQLSQQLTALQERLAKSEAALLEQQKQQQQQQQQHADDVAARLSGCGSQPHGSAESEEIPLPQEHREPQSTRRSAVVGTPSSSSSSNKSSSTPETAALLRIIALCLLYKTCSSSSTPAGSKSLPKVCSQMSAQTWQTVLRRAAAQLPRRRAPRSSCLDQWWGPKQSGWNPPQIVQQHQHQLLLSQMTAV